MTGSKIIGQYKYNIRRLSGDDDTDVQTLCERCSDFFELTEGRLPKKYAGNRVEGNHSGYKFWCEMGYAEVDRVKGIYGNKEHTVIVMNLLIKGF